MATSDDASSGATTVTLIYYDADGFEETELEDPSDLRARREGRAGRSDDRA